MSACLSCRGLFLFIVLQALLLGVSSLSVPPLVNPKLEALEAGSADQKIAGLNALSASANLRAQAAASQAAASVLHVQQLDEENKFKHGNLVSLLRSATAASDNAAAYSKRTSDARMAIEEIAATAVPTSQRLAVGAVQKLLAGAYKDLEPWRQKTLTDPAEESRKAGAAAAEPYHKMVNVLYNRIHAYQSSARSAASQANSAVADAHTVAEGAQARMRAGDKIGAEQDMVVARAMVRNSAQLRERARSMQSIAEGMATNIPDYYQAAHQAVIRAQFEKDPEAVPPPPYNPTISFTPPPPAA